MRDAGFASGEMRSQMQTSHELGEQDAQALKSIGIDLDAVRATLRDTFGQDALREPAVEQPTGLLGWLTSGNGHARCTGESKKALELALRHAIARKDNYIGVEHVLLGLLTCAESHMVTRALVETKLPVRELKARLLTAVDAAA